jgi:hypothetical protein
MRRQSHNTANWIRPASAGHDLPSPCDRAGLWESDGVHGFVDPEPIIQERLAQELQPLRDELAQAITWKHRRRIRRRIRQSEARIRREFSSAQW